MFSSKTQLRLLMIGIFASFLLAACAGQISETEPTQSTPENEPVDSNEIATPRPTEEYQIITLLPRDAIPAIDDPVFLTAEEADAEYTPDELVLGVNIDGDARAYSTGLLSRHEIVNDTVGGRKIAVTW